MKNNIQEDVLVREQKKVKKQNKKIKKKRFMTYVVSFIVFILLSAVLFFVLFGANAKIKNITVTGSEYFDSNNVIEKSGLSNDSNYYFIISSNIVAKFDDWEIVDVKVNKLDNYTINIDVSDKNLVGYYTENDQTYIVDKENNSYKYISDYFTAISKLPFINQFDQGRDLLVEALGELDKSILEEISEIEKYPTSYDENMLKLTMTDGNFTFVNYYSFELLSNYNEIANNIKIDNACIYFDESTKTAYSQKCE